MTLTLHVPSFIVGFVAGYILLSIALTVFFYRSNGPWDIGFSQGYDVGRGSEKKFQEEISK